MAISLLKIFFPDLDLPMESVVRLTLILPAIAYATTRGGEARKFAFTS